MCCRLSVVHRFSDDQVDCMCEALLQQYPGSRSRLVMLISSLSSSQLQRCDSEHLLRARAVVAFHTGRFTELYTILSGSHVFSPAYHPLLQKVNTPHKLATLSGLREVLRWGRVCMSSICLSVRYLKHVQTSQNVQYMLTVALHGSVRLWWQCNMLCTSGFVDDIMVGGFGHRPGKGDANRAYTQWFTRGITADEVWCLRLPCYYLSWHWNSLD